jgi:hypothetical protein
MAVSEVAISREDLKTLSLRLCNKASAGCQPLLVGLVRALDVPKLLISLGSKREEEKRRHEGLGGGREHEAEEEAEGEHVAGKDGDVDEDLHAAAAREAISATLKLLEVWRRVQGVGFGGLGV